MKQFDYFVLLQLSALMIGADAYAIKFEPEEEKAKDDSLVMVHVLFRHGQRTPDNSTIYPKDPFKNETYFPYGIGALTNEGKSTQYRIGEALRERYNDFLGVYTQNKVRVQVSPLRRTRASALLVLAGLFPPTGIERWNHRVNWQPIDYDYNPLEEDMIFLHGLNCQRYIQLSEEQLTRAVEEGKFGPYHELAEYLQENSGWDATRPEIAFNIYSTLLTEEEWGFKLPEWTEAVYPMPLHDIAVEYLAQTVSTDRLRQLSGGFILSDITNEIKAKLEREPKLLERRINLYSGHDFTIIALLATLGVYEPHHPPYGAYVVLEVHQIGEKNYGIKVFYQDYSTRSPRLLRLPGCTDVCPFSKFMSLYWRLLATKDMCNVKE